MVVVLGMMLESVLVKGIPQPSAIALKVTLIISVAIFTLSTVSGFVLGIVSLFGIQRHGKKGILGYALAGIVLNGLPWVIITTSSIVTVFEHMRSTP